MVDVIRDARVEPKPHEDYAVSQGGSVNAHLLADPTYPYMRLVSQIAGDVTGGTGPRIIQVDQIPQDALLMVLDRISSRVAENTPHDMLVGSQVFLEMWLTRIAVTNLLQNYVRTPTSAFPAQAIERIRDFYGNSNNVLNLLELENIGKLIVLDERNKKAGQSVGLQQQVAGEIVKEMTDKEANVDPRSTERRAQAYTLATNKIATRDVMYLVIQGSRVLPNGFWRVFGNALDFETLRRDLRDFKKVHPEEAQKIDSSSKAHGLDLGDEVFNDTEDFYKAADTSLENHAPYSELQTKDLSVLRSEFTGTNRVLDVGCGGGRLLIPLRLAGIPVEGLELNDRYAQIIHSQDASAVMHVGSMNHIPLQDGSVDGIYIMGRTFAHIQNIQDGVNALRELRRVLTPSGKVVIDSADITTGDYRQRSLNRFYALLKLGIWNHEPGSIHSSPNAVHFLDRLIPGNGQMRAMALLTGFKAEIIDEMPFSTGEGKTTTNIYWRLTPRQSGGFSDEELRIILTNLKPADARAFGIDTDRNPLIPPEGKRLKLEDY